MDGVIQSKAMIAEDLWRYGEDALAFLMLDADAQTYGHVMSASGAPALLENDPRQSWSISEMVSLAAVEVLTGSPRALARKRRRPEASLAEFWDKVGRPRSDFDTGQETSDALLAFAHLGKFGR